MFFIYSYFYSNNIVIYTYLYTCHSMLFIYTYIYSDSIWALHAFNPFESMVKYAQKNPIQVQKIANGRNKASQVCENFAH